MPNCIPLDPVLPANFDSTPNEERSKKQLDTWWDHPYGITQPDGKIVVRCLNGGAWDRSSYLGTADSYYDACVLAQEKQEKWVKTRAQPVFLASAEPPFVLVRLQQRPDGEINEVAKFDSMEEMNAYTLKTTSRQVMDVAPTLPLRNMSLSLLAWYKNELELSASALRNEANAIEALRDEVIACIRNAKNI